MSEKEKIKAYLSFKGISKNRFYTDTGLSVGFLDSGKSLGADKVKIIINTYPDLNLEWLIMDSGSMIRDMQEKVIPVQTFSLQTDREIAIQDIPLYDLNATAGLMAIFNETTINPEDYLRIPNIPPVDGAIHVRGESMTPILKSGDIIIYKKLALSLDSILWGQIYLLSFVAGGETFTVVKYLRKSDQPGYIRLVSQNELYQAQDIPINSIRALAIVKASITFHTIE